MAKELQASRELQNTGKILLPGGAGGRKFYKPSNFDKKKKRLEETGQLSLDDFNSAEEIGQFLDWYNQDKKIGKRSHFDNEVLEISKLLAKMQGRSSIVIGKK